MYTYVVHYVCAYLTYLIHPTKEIKVPQEQSNITKEKVKDLQNESPKQEVKKKKRKRKVRNFQAFVWLGVFLW